jgi:superfamily II DNA or RNA helicase
MSSASLISWRIGDSVFVRGERWRVCHAIVWPECVALRLSSLADGSRERTLLSPFDRPRAIACRSEIRLTRPRRWLHEVRRVALGVHPFGALRRAGRASIEILPYQLEPALAMLRHGATRVLIADGVGLGKTIQAGLLLHELVCQSDTFRALVVVPAGLREQWAGELSARFGLDTIQADALWVGATIRERPADVNPWSLPAIYIVSIDFLKRAEVLRAVEDLTWDLLIVDEAHLLSSGTHRRAAVHAVATRSLRLVMLTATPHAGDPDQFSELCQVGRISPGERPLVMFRRSRSAVGRAMRRRSVLLRVRPSMAEERMHELLERYTRLVWREARTRGDVRARLVSIVLRKRALSSAASLADSVHRRMELLAREVPRAAVQLLLPLLDEDALEDLESDIVLAAPGLADVRRERRWLASIAEAARHASRAETKAARLLRLLAHLREPAVVFTEYRDTLLRLARALAQPGRPIILMHGGMTPPERARAQHEFDKSGVLLLATDAAAEGLNLHHRCRVVIHYELPWSASRVEQRAGRVDRFGQNRRVHEIALVAGTTAERLVLAPLAARAARARGHGEVAGILDRLTDSRVADLIMQGTALEDHDSPGPASAASPDVQVIDLTREAAREVGRINEQRQWRATSDAANSVARGPIVAATSNGSSALPRGTLLVYVLEARTADGGQVHGETAVFHIRLADSPTPDPASIRSWVNRILQGAEIAVRATLDTRVARLGVDIRRAHASYCDELQRRERSIARARPSAARQLVQAGLFDRRALREASQRERRRAEALEESEARLDALPTTGDLIVGARLAAVLVVRKSVLNP